MSSEEEFLNASVRIKSLAPAPTTRSFCSLYALFKQAQQGDASGKRPGAFNMVARANSMLGVLSREQVLRKHALIRRSRREPTGTILDRHSPALNQPEKTPRSQNRRPTSSRWASG